MTFTVELDQLRNRVATMAGIHLRGPLEEVLEGLRDLLAQGAENPSHFRQATNWLELLDRLDHLKGHKRLLPDGMFARLWMLVKEARGRLRHDPTDAHALGQLGYLERALLRVLR